jgi:hypothetical protein
MKNALASSPAEVALLITPRTAHSKIAFWIARVDHAIRCFVAGDLDTNNAPGRLWRTRPYHARGLIRIRLQPGRRNSGKASLRCTSAKRAIPICEPYWHKPHTTS